MRSCSIYWRTTWHSSDRFEPCFACRLGCSSCFNFPPFFCRSTQLDRSDNIRRSVIKLKKALRLLWLVQRPVAVMQHILKTLSRRGGMVRDPYVETGATSKACMVKQQRYRFTGCDSDRVSVEKMPYLLQTFARQILNEDSEKVENADEMNAARLNMNHCTSAQRGLTRMTSETPNGLPAVQSLPPHVKQLISQYYCIIELHEMAPQIHCTA